MSYIRQAFKGRKILVTGHTGFKGAWLSLWLAEAGASVHGVALDPDPCGGLYPLLSPDVFASDQRCDLRDGEKLAGMVATIQPDYVFHLAAQPLVRRSFAQPIETLEVNILGSAHVLEAVRRLGRCCHVIFVTSDKCYRNEEWVHAYRETAQLGGKDPYSMSKAAAELVAECWRQSFFARDGFGSQIVSVRAGNVIGGGDYSEDRLVPDCVRAVTGGPALAIRSPASTRPWQHVLDCLHGYLTVAAKLPLPGPALAGDVFNFGPAGGGDHTVLQVAREFLRLWGAPEDAVQVVRGGDDKPEAGYLAVSIDKAARLLGWRPVWDFHAAIAQSVGWYRARHEGSTDMHALSVGQIREFEASAQLIRPC